MSSSAVDEKIMAVVEGVNWDALTKEDAAGFGLNVGFFRDSVSAWRETRAAYLSVAGGAISALVLALVSFVTGAGPGFTLGLVLTHMAVRTGILWWRARQAMKVTDRMEEQALESAQQLADKYPARDAAA